MAGSLRTLFGPVLTEDRHVRIRGVYQLEIHQRPKRGLRDHLGLDDPPRPD